MHQQYWQHYLNITKIILINQLKYLIANISAMDIFFSSERESQEFQGPGNQVNTQKKGEQDGNQQNVPQISFANQKEQIEYLKMQNQLLSKSLQIQTSALEQTQRQLHEQRRLRIGIQISVKQLRGDFQSFRQHCQCRGVLDLGARIFKGQLIGLKNVKAQQNFIQIQQFNKEDAVNKLGQKEPQKIKEQPIFNISPDTGKKSFQNYYEISQENKKCCIRNSKLAGWYNVVSNQSLPLQGQFTISFQVLQSEMNQKIRIGLVNQKWIDTDNNNGRNVYFYFWNSNICKLKQKIRVKDADPKLKQFPSRVDLKVNRDQMKVQWIFNGKVQAICQLPEQWTGQKLYAQVYLTSKDDKIEFL